MSTLTSAVKRLLLGRPFRNDRLSHTLMPKRVALPVFASDAMSSVSYAPQELFVALSVAGLSAYVYAPWIAALVCVVMLVVVASYRQNVHAYPSGGGDYEVATKNLGPSVGLVVASALLVDYILTVAVSVSAGVANIGSAIPFIGEHPVWWSLGVVLVITALNLRGVRESGTVIAIPVYLFLASMLIMLVTGAVRWMLGSPMAAESAGFHMIAEENIAGLALVFLLARSFTSGSAALTGVEAIANGVPAFRKPKSKNAAATLAMMGGLSVIMMLGLVLLTVATGAQIVDDPAHQLLGAPEGYLQKTLIAQVAETVFSGFPVMFYVVVFATGGILVLACNTAFTGFPILGSILAQDSYLPRQLHTRGDRLAFSNGIMFLAVVAGGLIVAFQASVTDLIHLYIVGVFVSFTASQAGMIRHWSVRLRKEEDTAVRRRMRRSQTINAVGFCFTATVLVIVVVTKFLVGAWIAILAMGLIYAVMKGVRRHYERVAREIAADEDDMVLPSRVHAIVLISRLHLPAVRALAFARATRPDTIEAVTVNVDPKSTAALAQEWEDRQLPVPLKVIDSPYREITKPTLDYVRRAHRDSPRDVIIVFIPEYVVGHWWERLLHNQSAFRLKSRLLFTPGIMVTSVPWQLSSSEALDRRMRAQAEREIPLHARMRGATGSEVYDGPGQGVGDGFRSTPAAPVGEHRWSDGRAAERTSNPERPAPVRRNPIDAGNDGE